MTIEARFRADKSPRIMYKGQEIYRHHQFPIANGQRVEVTIESYDPDWGGLGQYHSCEGVGLMIDREIRVDSISCRYLTLWPDSPPREQMQPPYYELLEIETGYYVTDPKSTIRLWLRRPFDPVELTCTTRDGHIHVWNVWNDGNVRHVINHRYNCSAMLVEKIDNGFRYRCNDGYPDEDFDDIIFRIERL